MKKVRFMLLAIAVIAIAGGTLAFKAKFDVTICTDEARQNAQLAYTCLIDLPGTQNDWTATCDDDTIIETDDPVRDQTLCYTFTEEEECVLGVTDCDLTTVDTQEN